MGAYSVISRAALVNGQPEDISVVLANFDAIATIINNLDDSNIAANANIQATKIAAGGSFGGVSVSGGSIGAPAGGSIGGVTFPGDASITADGGIYYRRGVAGAAVAIHDGAVYFGAPEDADAAIYGGGGAVLTTGNLIAQTDSVTQRVTIGNIGGPAGIQFGVDPNAVSIIQGPGQSLQASAPFTALSASSVTTSGLQVNGAATVTGNLTTNAAFSANSVTSNSLQINGNGTVTGILNVNNQLNAGQISASGTVSGGLLMGSGLNIAGAGTLNSLQVNGNATVTGNTVMNGTLTVGGVAVPGPATGPRAAGGRTQVHINTDGSARLNFGANLGTVHGVTANNSDNQTANIWVSVMSWDATGANLYFWDAPNNPEPGNRDIYIAWVASYG
jgi:hypothetical protein